MSTLEFFDYLAGSDATHELARQLVDAWVEQELAGIESAA